MEISRLIRNLEIKNPSQTSLDFLLVNQFSSFNSIPATAPFVTKRNVWKTFYKYFFTYTTVSARPTTGLIPEDYFYSSVGIGLSG
ncbi:hypothetical protein, partial [Parapedobacter sp. 2B3]|uniref:hypothetical protein n=1 Tax=Parapedobacter sp. 2B3 TaxID=3342381 RepID=UPI0035B663F2